MHDHKQLVWSELEAAIRWSLQSKWFAQNYHLQPSLNTFCGRIYTCAPLLALMRLLVPEDMDWVCIPGQLGATATWGIAISAICLLALLVFGAMRFMKPRRLLKTSKTAQGMVWHKELRKEDGK